LPGKFEFKVEPIAPFLFTPHLGRFTLRGRPTPALWYGEEGLLRLAVRVSRGFAGVEALFSGEPWRPAVKLVVYAESEGIAGEARRILASMIRSDFNYRNFLEAVGGIDDRLYNLALHYQGLRPGRCMSVYAALLDSVVKQRVALRIALAVYSRLVEKYGARLEVGSSTFHWHPLPERLAGAGDEELRRLGLTRVKARALREIALAELEGRLPSVSEVARDPEGVARELSMLYGVGPWTAQLAVAMVHPNFPLGPLSDLAVSRGLALVLGLGEAEARSVARKILELLPDYGGLVLYLAAYEYERSKQCRRRGHCIEPRVDR